LIYPSYPDTFWSFNHALRFIGKKASHPPMGLLTVAAMLPGEWKKKLVDLNVTALKDEDILWADYVFLSSMTIQKQSAKKVIARCIQLGRPVVAGGPLFTAEAVSFPEVNHLVLNEAEITLPQFLRDLEHGCPKPVYRSSDWADLSSTPVPLWDLINLKNYATMSIQYSRGCPFDCDFCDITVLYGRLPRTKSVDNVLRELDTLYERGWRGTVFFVDDNFIGNKKHLKRELLPAIIGWMKKKKYPFTFLTQVSINLADDDELIHLMVNAGFDIVFIGIETPDEQSLIECGKLQNANRTSLLEDVKKLHSLGLQVMGGFIVGFDSDKIDIFSRISRFINESGIVTSMVGLLNAPSGTRLYKRLIKENRIVKEMTGNNTDYSTNFLPKMDYKVLVEGYKKIISDIYSPEIYYKRVRKFLRHYRLKHKTRKGFSAAYIRGFFMSIYKLGIRKGVRWQYWKLVIWTILRRPRLMPLAITMAIYGTHFMRHFEISVD